MVSDSLLRRFLVDEAGISLTEGLISLPIVMLAFAAFVEFGYAMVQWNQTVKALQYGARLAAVSDSVTTAFDAKAIAASGTGGLAIPPGATYSCGPNLAGCNTAALNRIVYGSTGATTCQPLGTAGTRPAMCHLNPLIGKDNVVVTYQMSGLGYYGRPRGAVATIRMEVRNVRFNLPLLGGLLGLNTITIPPMPVTVTSEDLSTSSS